MKSKPVTLRSLLTWAQQAYALEAPARLHDRDVADDGAPDHTDEAKRFLALDQPRLPSDPRWTLPDDARRNACRTDADGFYITPLRAALEQVPGAERRALLRAVLPNVFYPAEACAAAGIPDWCCEDVLYRALTLLRTRYTDRPIPRRSKLSDAQLDAEAAA